MIPPRRSLLCLNYYSRWLLFSWRRTDMCACWTPESWCRIYLLHQISFYVFGLLYFSVCCMQALDLMDARTPGRSLLCLNYYSRWLLFSWRRTDMLSEFYTSTMQNLFVASGRRQKACFIQYNWCICYFPGEEQICCLNFATAANFIQYNWCICQTSFMSHRRENQYLTTMVFTSLN